jgi:hypothetical protein
MTYEDSSTTLGEFASNDIITLTAKSPIFLQSRSTKIYAWQLNNPRVP